MTCDNTVVLNTVYNAILQDTINAVSNVDFRDLPDLDKSLSAGDKAKIRVLLLQIL